MYIVDCAGGASGAAPGADRALPLAGLQGQSTYSTTTRTTTTTSTTTTTTTTTTRLLLLLLEIET